MGTADSERWKDDRIFTGSDFCYPVELFINLIEGEAFIFEHDKAKISSNAWCLISPTLEDTTDCSPAGLWKKKYNFSTDMSWDQLKSDLLDAFGRQSPYSITECVSLLKSLTKGLVENSRTFLLRVKWVLDNLGDLNNEKWTKLMFLMGLDENELGKITPYFDVEDIDELCELLGSPEDEEPVLVDEGYVKVEIESESEEDFVSVGKKRKRPKDEIKDISEEAREKRPNMERCLEVLGNPKQQSDDDYQPSSGDSSDSEDPEEVKRSVTEAKRSKPQNSIHPCDKCDKVFTTKTKMEAHRRDHLASSTFCGVCKETFHTKSAWNDHETNHHLGQCCICDLEISELKTMRKHHGNAHQGNQIKCPDCIVAIKYSEYGSHKCKQRSERFHNAQVITDKRKHLRMHTLKEGEDMRELKIITSHIRCLTEGKTVFYCGYCFQQFPRNEDLRLHILSDHDGSKYHCYICPYKTWNIVDCVEHMYQKHDVITDTYEEKKCNQCNFKTLAKGKSGLDDHIKAAHDKDFLGSTCNVCGKRFNSKYVLNAHVQSVHMKMKPFKCDKCPVAFVSKYTLLKHLEEKHGPDGPVSKWKKTAVCVTCGGKYKDQAGLDSHIKREHKTTKEPLQCKICGKDVLGEKNLKSHIARMHNQNNHKQCPYPGCTRVFKGNNIYIAKVHYSAEHKGVKPYGCKLCPEQSWVHSEDVAFHIATKHDKLNATRKDRKQLRYVIEDPHPAFILHELSLDNAFDNLYKLV